MIYSYAIFWFEDIFIFIAMITFGVGIIIIPILLIFVFISSLKNIKNENNKIIASIPIFIIMLTILLFFVFPPYETKYNLDFNSKLSLRNELVEKIKNKEILTNENNRIELPIEYSKISVNNYVYVYLNSENNTLIGFPITNGFPDQDLWLFYSSNGESLINENFEKSSIYKIIKKNENWLFVQFN